MTVSWSYHQDYIQIEMIAPTDGWVGIGFNTQSEITGTYLILGKMVQGKAEIVEHYTLSPGDYKSLTQLGVAAAVSDAEGSEVGQTTMLKFSLPLTPASKYQKELQSGSHYYLTMAYSREDDFQHHSIMRTTTIVDL